jgi:hypothetical protein
MLLGPSARGSHLLYVRSAYNRQQLVLGPLHPASTASDRVLYSQVPTARHDNDHDPGHTNTEDTPGSHYPRPPVGRNDTLWNTALGAHDAYVTRLRQKTGHPVYAVILHISR